MRLSLARELRHELNTYLAPDFSIFTYVAPDETCLSNLMAELFKPTGTHGQGDAFLRLFVKQLGCEAWLEQFVPEWQGSIHLA